LLDIDNGDYIIIPKIIPQIKDILGLPVSVNSSILGISGSERNIEVVLKITNNSILTRSGKVYFQGNFICIDDIINANAEYFI